MCSCFIVLKCYYIFLGVEILFLCEKFEYFACIISSQTNERMTGAHMIDVFE